MKEKPSKQMILAILGVIILILAVVGVSFAAFRYSKIGERVNTITTGSIVMSYNEVTNGINLVDSFPMSDAAGMALSGMETDKEQYFDFNVSATVYSPTVINYAITATKEADSTLPDSAVKVYLTNINDSSETAVLTPTLISNLSKVEEADNINTGAPLDQYILKIDYFTEPEIRSYRLRMWIDENYRLPDEQETYKLRVNVYGKAAE